jgi:hypothetical protein
MGALPEGYDLDSLLTLPEFAAWLGVSEDWVFKRRLTLPGAIIESRKIVRFHPRTHLTRRLRLKGDEILALSLKCPLLPKE